MPPFSRRITLLAPLGLLACDRRPRCASCGMSVDPTSRWFAEVEAQGATRGFDTPKCALRFLKEKAPQGAVFVRSYYRQQRARGADVVFAAGSDVLGPMGADLVPVEPELADQFKAEHRAQRLYKLDELTLPLIEST